MSDPRPSPVGQIWNLVAWLLIATLAVLTVVRFTGGLGAVTNLSDGFPWGLWVGFKLCGVGLAAGGFTITAAVHLLHLEDFEPIVRSTVLTAFLGYLLFILSLAFDLGRPWDIWHPLVMWNPRSVMFEVSWCVILYTVVLVLEFSPVLWERLGLERPLRIMRRISTVLVIAGVLLSTLHQSSLGSLFLIFPGRMHPLWYSPLLPLVFFVSALAAGLAMVVTESHFSRRVLGRPLEAELLARLSRVSVVVLALLLTLRLYDLYTRRAHGALWPLDLPAALFLTELALGAVVPFLLLASERFRASPRRLALGQGLVVLGFILNRLNVSITALVTVSAQRYVPSLAEVLISLGLVALGVKIYSFISRHLPIFPAASVGDARGEWAGGESPGR